MKVSRNTTLLFLGAAALFIVALSFYSSFTAPEGYVIGYVNPNPTEFEGAQGFLRNLPSYGFEEGVNTRIIRSETRDKAQIEKDIRDMVAREVDLIFTMTTPATKIAKKVTEGTGIPVVFILYDAVRSGVVENLLKHTGNLTGVQLGGSTPKALERLLQINPETRHVLTPVCFDTGAARRCLEDLRTATGQLDMQLSVAEVNSPEELHEALQAMPEDIDALFILHTWLVGNNLDPVIAEATRRGIPLLSAGHVHFDNGLLFSYGPRDEETGAQVARLAHSILAQDNLPANLPVETSDFFLGINLKTAAEAGIEVPYSLLQQADFILR